MILSGWKKGQNHGLLRPPYLVQNRLRSSGVAELVSLQIGQHLSIYFTQVGQIFDASIMHVMESVVQ